MRITTSNHPFFDSTPVTQSRPWQDFQHALGKDTLFVEENGWSCLLVTMQTKLGTYWLAPYGPVVKDSMVLARALKTLHSMAIANKIAWISIEPWSRALDFDITSLPLYKAKKNYNPGHTVVNNLALNNQDMRSKLSPTFRNLINRAGSRGISFKTSYDPADMQLFLLLLHEVQNSKKVVLHEDHYFKVLAETLLPIKRARLELAYLENTKTPVAAAVIIDGDSYSIYVYAATSKDARKHEPGTVLLWHAINQAKNRGQAWFDLFGVAPPDAPPSHPWNGFSTFKRKFGGEEIKHSGTWELVIDRKRHTTYRASLPVVRSLQKLKRNIIK